MLALWPFRKIGTPTKLLYFLTTSEIRSKIVSEIINTKQIYIYTIMLFAFWECISQRNITSKEKAEMWDVIRSPLMEQNLSTVVCLLRTCPGDDSDINITSHSYTQKPISSTLSELLNNRLIKIKDQRNKLTTNSSNLPDT